jgi:hypothetical protein
VKKSTVIDELCIRCYVFCKQNLPYLLLGIGLYFLFMSTSHAEPPGTNYLKDLKADVKATFGAGSDTEYFLLLAEGLGGAYAFWKSKSMPVLLGLPVLMVFTHWALK